jgi:predicted DNA-binding transcriptional regulator AlpA
MLHTYLQQLQETAESTGWELREACIDSGVSDTTFYRWQNGTTHPREKQASVVMNYMLTYAR